MALKTLHTIILISTMHEEKQWTFINTLQFLPMYVFIFNII